MILCGANPVVVAYPVSKAAEAGLAAYEHFRRPRMNALVLSNRQGGPEQVLQLVKQRAPNGFTRIEDVMSDDELDSIALQYRKTAGLEIEALNTQPSWEAAKSAQQRRNLDPAL
jgi:hypothetical protein